MKRLQIVLIGDAGGSQFQPAAAALCEFGAVIARRDISAALEAIRDEAIAPDVIVVVQQRPGEFSHRHLDTLRCAAPLAAILGMLGTWCEGESRTGEPWPGMIRTYWHTWLPRWLRHFRSAASGGVAIWSLPTTATDDDRLLGSGVIGAIASGQLVAVHSRNYDLASMICGACSQRGLASVWIDPRRLNLSAGAAIVVWDGCGSGALSQFPSVVESFAPSPVLALIDFPRADEVQQATDAGAAAVLAVPFLVEDFYEQVNAILNGRVERRFVA